MKRAAKSGFGRFAAVLAVFVLALQALVPAHAVAAPAGDTVEVCTAHGIETITLPAGDGGVETCIDCDDCCAAISIAGPATPSVRAAVRHKSQSLRWRSQAAQAAQARAPPRPFGQAPPQILNV